ncbi:glycerophosphodiester phosphodiesterase [Aminobacter sp. HY435]|uniref:glycerophosphodiester phosphodiesterase n=1 Tax=Aminobacter sp. HY435 TaxID=2970917 RepID=UPI0022B99E44|nr:glycerophosphodiester phosphodiesterase family protein [Aminobacter sp. HY435]
MVIGHRGAAGLEPENTLESFSAAYSAGVRAIELDVHWKMPELLVIHDATVDRTTNGTGSIDGLCLAQLRELDAGKGQRIPTLREVVGSLPANVALNIELKGPDTAVPVHELLVGHRNIDVLISSFNLAELERFRSLDPLMPVAPLFGRSYVAREAMVEAAIKLQACSINLSMELATPETIRFIRSHGYKVLVYTVNELAKARQLKSDGASGLFTDRPDIVSEPVLSHAGVA